ncbi:GNAT family N-acetyltransferase [Hyalangium rubrum]|uniref:GNAT family N-acetyltransferase n=1 Tax=Hyalangium rubrum TaxID=3103134 RepID=A0ABU5HGZ7_9BACT|nr:GNAT family N-acetyltransferase [Hyalangium sp. s54d21]MDY7232107.1 GNAT family N-acetyltransferase [Hyalangium sp. s54d21]
MRLVLATDAQRYERDLVNYPAWGPPLTVEGYVTREYRLRSHPWAQAELKTWLLCADNQEVLASCETYRTDSFLRAADGSLEAGDSYAIASVFTEERLRGKGHATRLMDLLASELERASPRVHSALLLSDVGAPLYRRSGYRETPAWDWRFEPEPGEPSEGVDRLLPETEMGSALARMRRPEVPFFYWPTPAQLDWHLERERIYSELLPRPRPEANGATAGESTALWYMVGKSSTLMVLMFDARTPEAAAALLRSARRVAHRAGLSRVVLWEEPAAAPLLAGVPGAVREAREGSLPMLRSLRPGLALAEATPIPRALWV